MGRAIKAYCISCPALTWYQFGWKLIYDPDFRDWYLRGKGGVLDNDFTILADDYFHVNLSVVAGCLLICYLLAPLVAFILFRYEQVWKKWVDVLSKQP